MTNQAKEFIKAVQSNEELKMKFEALSQSIQGKDIQTAHAEVMQPVLELAKEYGYQLREDDFQLSQEELLDDELEAVAGGRSCTCIVLGAGKCTSTFAEDSLTQACVCILAGNGINADEHQFRECPCMLYSAGSD